MAYDGETYIFDIWSKENRDKRKFSFRLKKMKNGKELKVVDLYPGTKENLGKGISIAIINESKKIFKKRIISSSNDDEYRCHSGESNSSDAIDKVWERMLKDGMVKYNKKKDYYYTI